MTSLLCSASGTGLSAVARSISKDPDIITADVEEILKETVDWEHPRFAGAARNMGGLCSRLDRDSVIALWLSALRRGADVLRQSDVKHRVLACHLTLFSGSRLERVKSSVTLTTGDLAPVATDTTRVRDIS